MSIKRLIISLLIISHVLINGAWASIHSSSNEGIEALHIHVEAPHQHSNSDGNADTQVHDESCHTHLSCQLAYQKTLAWAFQTNPTPCYNTLDYRSLAEQPPVPPPTI